MTRILLPSIPLPVHSIFGKGGTRLRKILLFFGGGREEGEKFHRVFELCIKEVTFRNSELHNRAFIYRWSWFKIHFKMCESLIMVSEPKREVDESKLNKSQKILRKSSNHSSNISFKTTVQLLSFSAND